MKFGECERCGSDMDAVAVNIEAFELSGEIVCDECADEVFAEASEGEAQ